MTFFGRKPKKPQSVPGAASGGAQEVQRARARGIAGRVQRRLAAGRPERADRTGRKAR